MNPILKKAESQLAYMVQVRRHLHQNPELSLEEVETSAYVKKELDLLNIPWQPAGPLGIIATIKGEDDGRMIALRADMDALPISEETGKTYASRKPGVMHACGHDAHTAMLLGAAKILKEEKLKGTVKLCFQQAEEVISGAKLLVPELKKFPIISAFGVHMASQEETGMVTLREGASAASSDIFAVKVKGRGGHGSRPDLSLDPNGAAAAMITEFARAKAQEISPFEPATIYVGMINGGFACNIVPEECVFKGTIRTLSPEVRLQAKAIVERVVEQVAKLYRVEAELLYEAGTAVLVNDARCTALARTAAEKIVGKDRIKESPVMLGSEDFSEFSAAFPSVFVHVGSGNGALGTDFPHHNPRFDIDEAAMAYGCALHVQYTLDCLQ